MNSRCFVNISLDNYRDNVRGLKKIIGQQKIIGVIKADYYGHGDIQLANVLIEEGVSDFAVAGLNEAIKLRNQGLKGSILILSYVEKEYLFLAKQYDCIVSLVSLEQLRDIEEFAKNESIIVEIKVDTGMNRIGLNYDLDDQYIKEIFENKNITVNGIFSHLATADSFDEKDKINTYAQKEHFDHFLSKVKALGYNTGRTHLCASSGILNYPEFIYDAVRPGFVLLGYDVGETVEKYQRKPVLSWYSKIEMIKTVKVSQGISYGHTYICDKDRQIASISVGYADGYPRRLSNKGYVLINGQKAPIVGRICMDQMMVDVTNINCQAQDIVTLVGEGLTINELASMSDTIVDEIVCDISLRVERNYL